MYEVEHVEINGSLVPVFKLKDKKKSKSKRRIKNEKRSIQ